ncbi:MAG TPA: hypothetical protein DEO84_03045, partial [candidate division Zixibacteria bacterium]|nr:hypothetical protein [candidate division Zixibacteria bacterium]
KIIRDESRITFDYEIAREEYSRRFYTVGGEAAPAPGIRIFSSLIQEGDNKSSPKSFEMTDDVKSVLQNAGDNRLGASINGVRYVGPDSGSYNLDSSDVAYYIYVGDKHGSYDVTFSFIGTGLGSYQATGGGVYLFVGLGLGDYEPIILIPLPQVKRYGSIGSTITTTDSSISIEGELVGSLYDRNSLSTRDRVQQGTSGFGSAHIKRNLFGSNSFIGLDGRFRKIGRGAIFPGRIDDVERYRHYDLDASFTSTGEKVEELNLSAGLDKSRVISLGVGYLTHPDIKSRLHQTAGLDWRLVGPLSVSSNIERTTGTRTWWKSHSRLAANLTRFQPTFRIDFEKRNGVDGFKYYEYGAVLPATYAKDINGTTELTFRNEKYLSVTWHDKFQSGSIQQNLNFIIGQSGLSGELAGSYYRKHYQNYSGTDAEQRTGWTRLTYSDPAGRGSLSLNERLSS